MNKYQIKDKLFKLYQSLPANRKIREEYEADIRARFNKENEDVTIIAPNCIAGEIYSLLGIRFNSPFINISMNRKAFIKMCKNLKEVLSKKPEFKKKDKTVTAEIEGYKIEFLHDSEIEKARQDGNRRLERVNWNKIGIICDDRGLAEEDGKDFDGLPYSKIMLTSKKTEYPGARQLMAYNGQPSVGKYNEKSKNGMWRFTEMGDFVPDINIIKERKTE